MFYNLQLISNLPSLDSLFDSFPQHLKAFKPQIDMIGVDHIREEIFLVSLIVTLFGFHNAEDV